MDNNCDKNLENKNRIDKSMKSNIINKQQENAKIKYDEKQTNSQTNNNKFEKNKYYKNNDKSQNTYDKNITKHDKV